MSDEYNAYDRAAEGDRHEQMARTAMPLAEKGHIEVSGGAHGMPWRLEVPDGAPGNISGLYTFFDERDLRRLLLALGRRAQFALERVRDARATGLAEANAAVERQAQALADLERGMR